MFQEESKVILKMEDDQNIYNVDMRNDVNVNLQRKISPTKEQRESLIRLNQIAANKDNNTKPSVIVNPIFKCPFCKEIFASIQEMKSHATGGKVVILCAKDGCDEKFFTKCQEIKHTKKVHSIKPKAKVIKKVTNHEIATPITEPSNKKVTHVESHEVSAINISVDLSKSFSTNTSCTISPTKEQTSHKKTADKKDSFPANMSPRISSLENIVADEETIKTNVVSANPEKDTTLVTKPKFVGYMEYLRSLRTQIENMEKKEL